MRWKINQCIMGACPELPPFRIQMNTRELQRIQQSKAQAVLEALKSERNQ